MVFTKEFENQKQARIAGCKVLNQCPENMVERALIRHQSKDKGKPLVFTGFAADTPDEGTKIKEYSVKKNFNNLEKPFP